MDKFLNQANFSIIITSILITTIISIPIIMIDLIIAYTNHTLCLTLQSTPQISSLDQPQSHITLKKWLLVQAYVLLALIPLFIFLYGLKQCSRQQINKFQQNKSIIFWIVFTICFPIIPLFYLLNACFGVIALIWLVLVSIFNLIWSIIGSKFFWGQLIGLNVCSKFIKIYVSLILIIGIVQIIGLIFCFIAVSKNNEIDVPPIFQIRNQNVYNARNNRNYNREIDKNEEEQGNNKNE